MTRTEAIVQTHQHTQARGRTERGLDPNAVGPHVLVATLRSPGYGTAAAAAVAAVENEATNACGLAVRFAACTSS